jgi:hypothetical protein
LDYKSLYGIDIDCHGSTLYVAAGSDGFKILRYDGATDQRPMLTLPAHNSVVDEASGVAAINLGLTSPPQTAVTLSYATEDGMAQSGRDYLPSGNVLTFNPGETAKSFIVAQLLDDPLDEPDEPVFITIQGADGAVLGTATTVMLTIKDNDPLPVVSFTGKHYTVAEAAQSLEITVVLSAPSEKEITVGYFTSDATALADHDYQSANNTLRFSPGETSKEITIPIIDDKFLEGDEVFHLFLHQPQNAGLRAPTSAVVTIVDNEPTPTNTPVPAPTATPPNPSTATPGVTPPPPATPTVMPTPTTVSGQDGELPPATDTAIYVPLIVN